MASPTRQNYGLVYERFEVASSLNNPRSLVQIGDDLYFVADDPTFGSEIFRVNKNAIECDSRACHRCKFRRAIRIRLN